MDQSIDWLIDNQSTGWLMIGWIIHCALLFYYWRFLYLFCDQLICSNICTVSKLTNHWPWYFVMLPHVLTCIADGRRCSAALETWNSWCSCWPTFPRSLKFVSFDCFIYCDFSFISRDILELIYAVSRLQSALCRVILAMVMVMTPTHQLTTWRHVVMETQWLLRQMSHAVINQSLRAINLQVFHQLLQQPRCWPHSRFITSCVARTFLLVHFFGAVSLCVFVLQYIPFSALTLLLE